MNDHINDDAYDMEAARAKFASKVDSRKTARKARQKTLSRADDGRTLKATGRIEHLNFKSTPAIKRALDKHVGRGNKSLWLEEAIIAKLKEEGYDVDA
jgi:hypothetical protein